MPNEHIKREHVEEMKPHPPFFIIKNENKDIISLKIILSL